MELCRRDAKLIDRDWLQYVENRLGRPFDDLEVSYTELFAGPQRSSNPRLSGPKFPWGNAYKPTEDCGELTLARKATSEAHFGKGQVRVLE